MSARRPRAPSLLLPFEPASQRLAPGRISRLDALVTEVRSALPVLLFAGERSPQTAAQFARVAAEFAGGGGGQMPDMAGEDEAAGALAAHIHRIERLVAE